MTDSQSRAAEAKTPDIETGLRQSAPDLPSTLRNRTLTNCKTRVAERERRHKRLQWQLTWAVVGVLAVQLTTLSRVEAQNTQLLTGNSPPPLFASLSFSEINRIFHQRSCEVAQLIRSSGVG